MNPTNSKVTSSITVMFLRPLRVISQMNSMSATWSVIAIDLLRIDPTINMVIDLLTINRTNPATKTQMYISIDLILPKSSARGSVNKISGMMAKLDITNYLSYSFSLILNSLVNVACAKESIAKFV